MLEPELVGESAWNTYRSMAYLIAEEEEEENPEQTTRLMTGSGNLSGGKLPKGTGYRARLKKRLMTGPGNLSAGRDPRQIKDLPPK